MPYTEEPPGLRWINNLNPTSFSTVVTQICWLVGSLAFTWMGCVLLWRESQMAMLLVGSLLAAWGVKTGAGVVDAQQKRMADPRAKDVIEAKERGKLAGAAAATVLAEKAKDAAAARESGMHPIPTH